MKVKFKKICIRRLHQLQGKLLKLNRMKFSVGDCQDSFMVFDATQDHLRIRGSHGASNQPFILVVGKIFHHIEIIVYYDSIMCKVHSILKDIQICYKIFHLFNLE